VQVVAELTVKGRIPTDCCARGDGGAEPVGGV
jgi:hypothetical protein